MKQRYGDWEIDTIIGEDQKGAILTMVERKSNYLIMQKLKSGKNHLAILIKQIQT
jgi:transposase, IS30 family